MNSKTGIVKGSETVFFGDAGPVILSGGIPVRIVLTTEGDESFIGFIGPNGAFERLKSGSAEDMAIEYTRMCAELRDEKKPTSAFDKRPFISGVSAAAIFALATFGAYQIFDLLDPAKKVPDTAPAPAAQPVAVQPLTPGALTPPQNILQIPGVMEILERAAKQAENDVATNEENANEPPILRRPSFLTDPKPSASSVAPAPAPKAAEAPKAVTTAPEPKQETPAAVAEAAEEPNTEHAQKEAATQPQKLTPNAFLSTLPAWTPPPSLSAPTAQSEPVAAAPQEGTEPVTVKETKAEPEQPTVETSADAEQTVPKGEEKKTETQPAAATPDEAAIDPARLRDEAREAAAAMTARGMNPMEVVSTLDKLRQLEEADEITPEMIADLPHEVANLLRASGLVTEGPSVDAPDGIPYRIIRLPQEVIERHRGPDGIADIPELNTWASTGNFVSIPLPGGGDVEKPEDLLDFGLQP